MHRASLTSSPRPLSLLEIFSRDFLISDITDKQSSWEIPVLQRDFVWGKLEVIALLDDLSYAFEEYKKTEAKKQEDKSKVDCYFMGTILVGVHERGVCALLDGQQRIVSLITIARAICAWMALKDPNNAGQAHTQFNKDLKQQQWLRSVFGDTTYFRYLSGSSEFKDMINMTDEEVASGSSSPNKFVELVKVVYENLVAGMVRTKGRSVFRMFHLVRRVMLCRAFSILFRIVWSFSSMGHPV